MKIAIIKVEMCDDCPHMIGCECWAAEVPREIPDATLEQCEFPSWCPLPDAPEGKASA